jgi:hypothetical protein
MRQTEVDPRTGARIKLMGWPAERDDGECVLRPDETTEDAAA